MDRMKVIHLDKTPGVVQLGRLAWVGFPMRRSRVLVFNRGRWQRVWFGLYRRLP